MREFFFFVGFLFLILAISSLATVGSCWENWRAIWNSVRYYVDWLLQSRFIHYWPLLVNNHIIYSTTLFCTWPIIKLRSSAWHNTYAWALFLFDSLIIRIFNYTNWKSSCTLVANTDQICINRFSCLATNSLLEWRSVLFNGIWRYNQSPKA